MATGKVWREPYKEQLIRHKAESITSIEPGGICLINADNDYFVALKTAIQTIRPIPVMSFGSNTFCDGQLINASFDAEKSGWQVQAKIFGNPVHFFVSMVNSYAPLASVSALTIVAYMGLDLIKACQSLRSFCPFDFDNAGVDQIKLAISVARKNSDFLIVSPHWGKNWRDTG